MPQQEEKYVNIDCLDAKTKQVIPLKEEPRKISSEKLAENRNRILSGGDLKQSGGMGKLTCMLQHSFL